MAIERAMALTNRLLSHARALAAVTAYVRLAADGSPADPALDALTDDERQIVTSFARFYMHQALD